jgi:hypothetical protein
MLSHCASLPCGAGIMCTAVTSQVPRRLISKVTRPSCSVRALSLSSGAALLKVTTSVVRPLLILIATVEVY